MGVVYFLVLFLCAESAATIHVIVNSSSVNITTESPTTPAHGIPFSKLSVWDLSLETVMLVLLLLVLMVFLYFGVRIYSRMANIYMLQTYGSQIVAEIVSSTKLKHALTKLVR